jgi:hypothetical protein
MHYQAFGKLSRMKSCFYVPWKMYRGRADCGVHFGGDFSARHRLLVTNYFWPS